MAADGSITFSTALDNSQLEKDLKKAEADVERLRKRLDASTARRTAIEEEMGRTKKAIEATSKRIEEYKAKIEQLRSATPSDSGGIEVARRKIEGLQEALSMAESLESEYAKKNDGLGKKWAKVNDEVQQHEQELAQATSRAGELSAEYQRAYSGAGPAIRQGMQQASDGFAKLGDRINGMVRRVFMLQVALSALRGVRTMLADTLMQNERLSASVAALRGAFQGVVNYIANAVVPAFAGMVNACTAMIVRLASIVDSLFGTCIVASIRQAQAAAQATWRQADASDAASKAATSQAKATKRLGKEAEKAAKSLMGFDEINQLAADNNSGGDADGSLGGAGGASPDGGGLKPDWDALDVGKIGEKLAEVMIILGAALMAVGAILAFSGINIPLGLTLMAIGALMIYTAYRERWDELPEKVRSAITTALVLAGVVLVVLGAVLAFSGVNIPLGIGLMAAGLVLLGVATALNWGALSEQLRAVISAGLVVVGIVALVVGAVLAFSGINIPLGIGLMALGALAIATVGVINWEVLKANLQQAISSALELIGIIAVVIGAVLAFTGTNIPVGVGLMALGAAAMVASAALNWDQLKGKLDLVISKALKIAGIIAVVIGAVLAFSAANVPLGVALMAAGAAAVATSVKLNWEQLKDKVSTVLSTMLQLAGAVALAIGAVIALSGVNLPLGIALIAAGALALVTSSALNWDKMPDQVRTTVGLIAAVAGAALLALGIILCLSGFGIPLGIALIAAGAAGLATAASINWDFLQQKAGEIWDGIVNWWTNGPGRIFTSEWWEDKFSSIGTGLENALNAALNAASRFISSISSGISSAMSGLSRLSSYSSGYHYGGYTYSAVRASMPHLAQGTVIPPNREFMAVLGDQRRGNNIETPEGLMRQVVREEAGTMMAELVRQLATMGPASAQPARSQGDLVLVVDGRELGRASMRGIRDLDATGELGSGLSLRYS